MAFRKRKDEGVVIKPIELAVPTNAKEIYQAGDTKIAITDKYELLQPPVPENFEILLEEVIIKFSSIDETGDPEERLLRAFLEVATKRGFSSQEASSAWYHVRNACLYFGKLSPMFLDTCVEDISCSGPNIPVYVYHQRYGFIPSNISFDASELKRFIHSLAQKSGFILSSDNPIIDATLPDGSRVNIALEVAKEPSFTIRKVKSTPLTPKALIESQTWPAEVVALLWVAMENKCSTMFIGGTASGKTTAMNATAFFIPLNSKIVSIEDTYEISLPHKNWTSLIVRGNTTTHDLLKATLRQRPEYIIIGEARSTEVREMFSAMGVGHAVLTTFHGSNAQTVAKRLFGDPFQIKSDQFQLLDFIITMNLTPDRKRKCVEVMLVGEGKERLVADVFGTRIYHYNGNNTMDLFPAFKRIAEKGMKDTMLIRSEFQRKLEIISRLPSGLQEFLTALASISKEGEKK
ncbi:MAG: type II/IV secretion system ATPase subunit [Archaeoglobaceae archaeon]